MSVEAAGLMNVEAAGPIPPAATGVAPRWVTPRVAPAPKATFHGYIAQWLERLTADQQVPGSNPSVPFAFARVCFT